MRKARVLPPLLSLRAFESASRHLSFSKAADELCVTQSAISRHIRNLETFLNRRLFIRQGRAVILSEHGKAYFDKVAAGLSIIEDATAGLVARSRSSVLTVDVLPTLGMRWLAPRLHKFSQAHPAVEIHLISSIEPVSFDAGRADVAIRVGRPRGGGDNLADEESTDQRARIDLEMIDDWDGVHHVFLFPDTLVAVYNPDFVTPPPSPAELSRCTLIATTTRAHAWQDWLRTCGIENLKPKRTLSFGHFFMSLEAALEGRGIAILPEVLIEPELASGKLRILFHKAESEGGYYLLFPKTATADQKVANFQQWISRTAADYLRQRPDADAG